MMGTLGFVTPVRAYSSGEELYMQAASGRVAEALAAHFDKVCLCASVVYELPPAPFDAALTAPNVELIAQPPWRTTAQSLFHFWGIARAYLQTCRRSDVLFVRGMCPYTAVLYLCAMVFRKPICHWIVGDPVTLLRAGRRNGRALDALALLYALQNRLVTRAGRWLTGGALLCNGKELARAHASPRTATLVSSTIRESEFFYRTDTCQGPAARILFVGFIRPEKGIEYLLEAVSQLEMNISWELEIVGRREFPDHAKKLDEIADERRIRDRVRWLGYLPNGEPLWDRMRAADLLVLPTLSEGTPHVLVEARANGLPCISTTVGGVPSVVKDGYDALLVPPKDARALTQAIERIIGDAEFRRKLIRNGLVAARQQTLERFVSKALNELGEWAPAAADTAKALQERGR
jgi:glycosyltransferase involved in cell wall biosynthesis